MNQFLSLAIRLAVIFAVIFFLVQPYNWFCQITQKCSPFFFSYLIPSFEGKNPIEIELIAKNYNREIEFTALQPHITTVSNRIVTATYKIKNVSGRFVRFRIKLIPEGPVAANEYTTIYQCLCNKEYKLVKGEEKILEMKLKLNSDLDKALFENKNFDQKYYKKAETIKISYEVLKY
jgi:cytochrome c oxidase assembly protein Cox11